MTLRLNGSTSGYTEIDAPAVAGSNTLVLPTGNGSADQALVTNGSGTLSFADRGRMVLETAQATTSGTSKDFTSIPSWVKRITVMLQGVSGNGASHNLLQLGTSSGVTTSGYVCSYGYFGAPFSTTAGFGVYAGAAGEVVHGNAIITNLTGNTWVFSYSGGVSGTSTLGAGGGGSIALGATLDRVRLTHVNGTDTFDAGSINILYEG
jgi:hypothetical protein